ncbi:MAG: hypothetical protein CM1200mP29_04470 [Verrucomicrobiota bacterium]|nr:MAG: hypothetical protein CM1200mP29_04470 [Verrucomicrobiota bacterium]
MAFWAQISRGSGPSIQGYFLECLFSGEWEFRADDRPAPLGQALNAKPTRAVYDQFHEASRVLFEAQTLVHGERLSPVDSLARFELADGLAIETVLHEPLVAQPTHLSFDARGRLWVSHYVQYPYPAGLRQISRDKYYRAKYDREPKPPPHHTPGRSRVTVHEDTNGDGSYDTHKVFADKLSLANAALPGRDGVWVMHTPHLLFYPDRNADDIPDGDPVVTWPGLVLRTRTRLPRHHMGAGWLAVRCAGQHGKLPCHPARYRSSERGGPLLRGLHGLALPPLLASV